MELKSTEKDKTYLVSIQKYENRAYKTGKSFNIYSDAPIDWLLDKIREFVGTLTPETQTDAPATETPVIVEETVEIVESGDKNA